MFSASQAVIESRVRDTKSLPFFKEINETMSPVFDFVSRIVALEVGKYIL